MENLEKVPPNNDTSINVNPKIDKADRPHIVDLETTPDGIIPKSLENVPLIYPSVSYLIYLKRLIQHLFLTIIFDWTMIITHPVNFLLTFVVFPLAAIFLFFLEIFLRFISYMKWDTNDDDTVIQSWSKLVPSQSELLENLRLGIKSLDQLPSSTESRYRKGFNLNRMQFLLYLTTLLQERDEKKVSEAYRMISSLKHSSKNDDENNDDLEKIQKIYEILKESESGIHKQLEEFNLKFTSLSELNTLGGPYAGMFWSDEGNFIVIAFKGTTPTSFNEWLMNGIFQRMDARSYLFGEVHEGFYTRLFPMDEYDSTRVDRRCPATRIIEAVRVKGEIIRKRNMESRNTTPEDTPMVNIYVTGHSLGGALANLLYARLLKSPQSLGKHCLLRDGTTFACPTIGDSEFAAEFASLCNRSIDEYKTMWRIVNDNDIIPRGILGHQHPRLRRYTKKIHVLNYFHTGDEVRFYQDGSTPSSMRNIYSNDKELIFIEKGLSWGEWRSLFGFYDPFDHIKRDKKSKFDPKLDSNLYPYEKFLIGPLSIPRNHATHRYFAALEKSREFFEDSKVNINSNIPVEVIV